jgi:hypothetical protein
MLLRRASCDLLLDQQPQDSVILCVIVVLMPPSLQPTQYLPCAVDSYARDRQCYLQECVNCVIIIGRITCHVT